MRSKYLHEEFSQREKKKKRNKSFYYAISVSPYYIRALYRRARIKRHFAIRDIVRFIFEVVKTGVEGVGGMEKRRDVGSKILKV